jgi:hypothetical protein
MNAVAAPEAITVTAPRPAAPKSHLWAGTEFGFTDLLAVINPLQHIPIVGMIYRSITGDTIGNVARVVGDGLYGGLLGLASGVADVASVETTGEDIGQHIIATLEDIGDAFSSAGPTKVASNPVIAAPPAADGKNPDPPKLPLLGSATTAGELAAAAPISPLLAPKLAAQAARPPAPGGIQPLSSAAKGIPIDVSDRGIALMRATSAAHSPQPVPLNLPPGAFAAAAAGTGSVPTTAPAAANFTDRMRDGLAKYDALIAARARDPAAAAVDQQI